MSHTIEGDLLMRGASHSHRWVNHCILAIALGMQLCWAEEGWGGEGERWRGELMATIRGVNWKVSCVGMETSSWGLLYCHCFGSKAVKAGCSPWTDVWWMSWLGRLCMRSKWDPIPFIVHKMFTWALWDSLWAQVKSNALYREYGAIWDAPMLWNNILLIFTEESLHLMGEGFLSLTEVLIWFNEKHSDYWTLIIPQCLFIN